MLSLRHIDTCLPDYFNGSDLPYISIPVDGDTTIKQVKEALRNEVRSDVICNEDSENPFSEDDLNKAIDALAEPHKDDMRFDSSLGVPQEDDMPETVFAYFVIDKDN